MPSDRFISAQFCDDIRQEIGNKFSLVGCYGPSVEVQPIPSVLPKLCAMIKVYTPVERPFEKLAVRIVREGKAVAEILFAPESLASPTVIPAGSTWQIIIAAFVMVPFPVEAPLTLRVEAEDENGVINGGYFWITPPANPPLGALAASAPDGQ